LLSDMGSFVFFDRFFDFSLQFFEMDALFLLVGGAFMSLRAGFFCSWFIPVCL